MVGPRNTAADVALLLEQGLNDGSIAMGPDPHETGNGLWNAKVVHRFAYTVPPGKKIFYPSGR